MRRSSGAIASRTPDRAARAARWARWRPPPSPMPRRRKSARPLLASGGSPLPQRGRSQRLVLLSHAREHRRRRDAGADGAHLEVFFRPANARSSADGSRGRTSRESSARARALGSVRPAAWCFSTKARTSPWKLVRATRSALLRYQPGDAREVEARLRLVERRARDPPYSSVASVMAALSTRTRRNISYLTWTTSRGSKNSLARNFGSLTLPGEMFSVPSSRSAAAFGSFLDVLLGTRSARFMCNDNYDARANDVKWPRQRDEGHDALNVGHDRVDVFFCGVICFT